MGVSLKQGLVNIHLKPGNAVKLDQVRKAIENDAFTPKDAKVVAVGELVSQNGKLEFKVAGTNETFPAASTPHKSWQTQVGQKLTVNGLISTSGTLQITSVSGESAAKK